MNALRLAVLVVGLVGLASACTSSEPETKVEPEPVHASDPESIHARDPEPVQPVWIELSPEPGGIERELGPLLGGKVRERAPTPGRWSSRVSFSQHRFITMEHTIASGISGSAVLRLGDDGSARACFAIRDSSSSDVGRYQTRDGKDHHYGRDDSMVYGMTGTWKLDGSGLEIEIVFDRRVWRTCEVDPNKPPFAEPPLRCFAFAANAKVPSNALLCQVPETFSDIAKLALLIGDSPRAGSWELRRDPSGHGDEPPADAKAWLLLGAEPGLELEADDDERFAKPLTIQIEKVEDPVALADPP
jgi:hypothetical protein